MLSKHTGCLEGETTHSFHTVCLGVGLELQRIEGLTGVALAPGEEAPMVVMCREASGAQASTGGVALTAETLEPHMPEVSADKPEDPSADELGESFGSSQPSRNIIKRVPTMLRKQEVVTCSQWYYFEVKALQKELGMQGTLSIGFAWGVPAGVTPPDRAKFLPQSYIVGGDPPHWFFNGPQPVARVDGWLPAQQVESGTTVGALLEVRHEDQALLFTVFNDGKPMATHMQTCEGGESAWAFDGPPNGVIDLCGSVQKVRLRRSVGVPEGVF